MSTVKNLWGELPLAEAVRTPAAILREQANQLTELTKGLLEGEVISKKITDKNSFFLQLQIVAPSLDGYRFVVMDVSHTIMLYPLSVFDRVGISNYECDNEEQFINVIGHILSSGPMHKAIAALLSQIASEQAA